MRRTLLIAALTLLTAGAVTAQHDEVPWLEGQTWDEIVAQATAEDRHILIDFYATWCGPCKMLDAQVYNQPEVIEALAPLICFKVDVDKPAYQELKTQFGVQAMPTMVVCRPDGSEVDRFLGFRPAGPFVETVQDYVAGRNTYTDLTTRLAAAPDDVELLYLMGAKHAERNEADQAKTCFDKVLELDADNTAGFAAQALPQLAQMAAMAGDFAGAGVHLERVVNEYPDTGDRVQLLSFLAWIHGRTGEREKQVGVYRTIVKEDPENAQVLNALAWTLAELEVDLAEATAHALKAAEISGNAPEICDTVAEVYHKRGMADEALAWMDKAIEKAPDNEEFKARRAKMAGTEGS